MVLLSFPVRRPLSVIGGSTVGFLAYRMIQRGRPLGRDVRGADLVATSLLACREPVPILPILMILGDNEIEPLGSDVRHFIMDFLEQTTTT